MGKDMLFPKDFLWGAGTSALQHEGSPLVDGAGQSVMYRWAHTSDKMSLGQNFDVSADFYHRFRDDIKLMRQIGLKAYNFEVSWSRIMPNGVGEINQPGLDFYDRLVDELLEANIMPLCNLYVFDHPAVLEDQGGWLNRDMAGWFADYSAAVFDRLGDRVEYWTTMCEPRFLSHMGYVVGAHPPEKTDISEGLRALHHLLLAQGRAVQAFRASGAKGQIGNQHLTIPISAASDSKADVAAAQRANAYFNLIALDPQHFGHYPPELIDWYGADWPTNAIYDGDMTIISTPMDFFGMDYYMGLTIKHDEPNAAGLFNGGLKTTPAGGQTNGAGVHTALTWVRERYNNPPILLLEIGKAGDDKVVKGEIKDTERIAHLKDMLTGAYKAIQEGVDLRGSFVWSFLDGWEFDKGLSDRYGLVYVDYKTGQRIIKASGHWYGEVINANGLR